MDRPAIVLHQFEISPFCDKVRRILHAKRVPYEVREVPLVRSLRDVRRVNRIGKLPCLEHAGRRVADSTDIAHYLEAAFPAPPLLPADPAERGLCHVLEDWADESLYYYEMVLRFTRPHNAARFVPRLLAHDPPWFRRVASPLLPVLLRRQTAAQGVGRKPSAMVDRDVERHVEALAGLLGEREWLVGQRLSLADIAVFAQLACIRAADEGAKAVERAPAVAAWMERVERATAKPPEA
jgi:glutathione S-transferase